MNDETKLKTLHATGRRLNIAEEPSLFLPHEDTPAETERKAAAKAVQTQKSAKALAVVGAALVWVPILFSIAYTVFLLAKGTQYAGVYGFAVLTRAFLYCLVGAVLLYLAARKLGFLRRAVGTVLVFWIVMQLVMVIQTVFGDAAWLSQLSSSKTGLILTSVPVVVWYLCLPAIAVLSIFLLARAFSKKNAA